MMALFGLLWLMRIRAEVRRDKRKRCQSGRLLEEHLLLPPPVSFADPKHSVAVAADDDDDDDDGIPPPPPPPLRQNVQIHRSSSIREGLHYRSSALFERPAAQSRSAQNIPLECTCPLGGGRPIRRPAVRFCDDPFGFYSARGGGQSWNYPSVVSTLPRARPTTSRSAHG